MCSVEWNTCLLWLSGFVHDFETGMKDRADNLILMLCVESSGCFEHLFISCRDSDRILPDRSQRASWAGAFWDQTCKRSEIYFRIYLRTLKSARISALLYLEDRTKAKALGRWDRSFRARSESMGRSFGIPRTVGYSLLCLPVWDVSDGWLSVKSRLILTACSVRKIRFWRLRLRHWMDLNVLN